MVIFVAVAAVVFVCAFLGLFLRGKGRLVIKASPENTADRATAAAHSEQRSSEADVPQPQTAAHHPKPGSSLPIATPIFDLGGIGFKKANRPERLTAEYYPFPGGSVRYIDAETWLPNAPGLVINTTALG